MIFGGMKLYTVHIKPGVEAQQNAVFVREGFNPYAFILSIFWAIYHRLWKPVIIILVFEMALMSLRASGFSLVSAAAMDLGFHVILGFMANDWIRAKLTDKGYILADISAGDTRLRAEQRYFERVLA